MKFLGGGCAVIVAIGILVGLVSGLGGCPHSHSRTGNPAVYARIDALTDCTALQGEVNQAEANFNREKAAGAGRAEYRQMALDYWDAAAERMKALGCGGK